MFKKIIDTVFAFERIIIRENERAIALDKGRFLGILTPGEHRLRSDAKRLEIELHDLAHPEFKSKFDKALYREHQKDVAAHLTEVRTKDDEIAVIEQDGKIFAVLTPEGRAVFWTAAGPWTVQRFGLTDDPKVPADLATRLKRFVGGGNTMLHEVPEGHVGLLFVEGAFKGSLEAGVHTMWAIRYMPHVRNVDLRQQTLDVTGQEVLTKDRVTIRVNLSAGYQIVDPVKAANNVKDAEDALYRAIQLAFRKALGTRTLDQVLSDKEAITEGWVEGLRAEMVEIGVSVGQVALKDVVLPGEMRDILNKVVTAEKEAEANVIRRREDTNATRALLNTAKIMADNPVMLRLKELEALGEIAGKVERLTVHNGTSGLLNDLVNLSD